MNTHLDLSLANHLALLGIVKYSIKGRLTFIESVK